MRDRILEILRRHNGRGNAITVAQIAEAVGHIDTGLTNPQLRNIIREIIKDGEHPIGSCQRGYFTITTEEERNRYIADLVGRRNGLSNRIRWVRNLEL